MLIEKLLHSHECLLALLEEHNAHLQNASKFLGNFSFLENCWLKSQDKFRASRFSSSPPVCWLLKIFDIIWQGPIVTELLVQKCMISQSKESRQFSFSTRMDFGPSVFKRNKTFLCRDIQIVEKYEQCNSDSLKIRNGNVAFLIWNAEPMAAAAVGMILWWRDRFSARITMPVIFRTKFFRPPEIFCWQIEFPCNMRTAVLLFLRGSFKRKEKCGVVFI